jgi:hypothetical protein
MLVDQFGIPSIARKRPDILVSFFDADRAENSVQFHRGFQRPDGVT